MIPDIGAGNWYIVRTHARAEVKAAVNLERQGFATYLPRYLKRRRHARRVEIVPAPLFPRYLFVAIDVATQRWRSIQSTFGVAQLVCNGEDPSAVSAAVVDELRRREDEQGFVQLARRGFAHGEKVRVVEGVFSACLGLFEGMTDNERVTILLDLLGRKVRVVMDLDAVAAA
jgi:transcriptional antiterminator RfaH